LLFQLVEDEGMEDESSQSQGFTVRDKRRFKDDGEKHHGAESSRPEQEEEKPRRQEEAEKTRSSCEEPRKPLPPVDFSGFIMGLAETALLQLGFLQIQGQEQVHKDLPGAKHTIDLIALLEEKTRGNLTEEEKKILRDTLFQLRMAFVEASKEGQ